MNWRVLLVGVILIIVLGVGGLVYRNVAERSGRPIACPIDAKACPDGTTVAREGLACQFPECALPNVSLTSAGIAYAVPVGFASISMAEAPGAGGQGASDILAAYESAASSSPAATSTDGGAIRTQVGDIVIRRFPITASSSGSSVVAATAIDGASGVPVAPSRYTSTNIASRQYTVVEVERFEGDIDTAYYLVRQDRGDVLRFDALDRGVDWSNPSLDVSSLPAHAALRNLLTTLQGL